MKKVLILCLILITTVSYLKSQDIKKYKITATVAPMLFYNFDDAPSSEHFNNYNYSLGIFGSYYLGRKPNKIRFSINTGLNFKTKRYTSHYFISDNSVLAISKNDYRYMGIPILLGVDIESFKNGSIDLLIGITLNKIVSTSYQHRSEKGISEVMDSGLSYTGLNEFYSQLSLCIKSKNKKSAFSLGPFISYKYFDSIEFSDSYFHKGRFSFGLSFGASIINYKNK